jgi:hypothetical protein
VPIIAYLMFFLGGLGFGYAAPGRLKWLPIGFPILLWVGAVLVNGIDLSSVIRLVVALAVMLAGIVLGMALEARGEREAATEAG